MKKLFPSLRMNLAAGALAVVLFSSCSKSDNNYVAPDVAGIMAVNLVSDKEAGIGITFSGQSLTSYPLPYAGYSGGYLSVYPNSYVVQVYNAAGYPSPISASSNTFLPKKYYSLFVTGANNVYANVVTEDNFDSLNTTNGQAYIRYINAIPDSTDPRVTITGNGTAVLDNTAHYQTVSQFTQITPGQATINISNNANITANRTITLEAQKAYTVLLTGVPGAGSGKEVEIKFVENGRLTQ